jgi:hypothetical protein
MNKSMTVMISFAAAGLIVAPAFGQATITSAHRSLSVYSQSYDKYDPEYNTYVFDEAETSESGVFNETAEVSQALASLTSFVGPDLIRGIGHTEQSMEIDYGGAYIRHGAVSLMDIEFSIAQDEVIYYFFTTSTSCSPRTVK